MKKSKIVNKVRNILKFFYCKFSILLCIVTIFPNFVKPSYGFISFRDGSISINLKQINSTVQPIKEIVFSDSKILAESRSLLIVPMYTSKNEKSQDKTNIKERTSQCGICGREILESKKAKHTAKCDYMNQILWDGFITIREKHMMFLGLLATLYPLSCAIASLPNKKFTSKRSASGETKGYK